ncbi:hypothetical protein TWF192_007139 [Orbilia oligospora]|nr:hypothetical protein TWF192_007139 [Orbilia oligospora]
MHIYTGKVTNGDAEASGEVDAILLLADAFRPNNNGFIFYHPGQSATPGGGQSAFHAGNYAVLEINPNDKTLVKKATYKADGAELRLTKANESDDEIVVTLNTGETKDLIVSLKLLQVIDRPANAEHTSTYTGLISGKDGDNHIIYLSIPEKEAAEKSLSLFRFHLGREVIVERLLLELLYDKNNKEDENSSIEICARNGQYHLRVQLQHEKSDALSLRLQKGGVAQHSSDVVTLIRHNIFDASLIIPTILTLENDACQAAMYYVANKPMHDSEAAINMTTDIVALAKEGAEAVPGVGALTSPYDLWKASVKFWFDGIKIAQKYLGDLPTTGFISPGESKTFWDIDQNFTTGATLRITIPTFKPTGDDDYKYPYILYTWYQKDFINYETYIGNVKINDFFEAQGDWGSHNLRLRSEPKALSQAQIADGWTTGIFKFPLVQQKYAQNYHAFRVPNLRLHPDYAEDVETNSKDSWINDAFLDTVNGKLFRKPFDPNNSLNIESGTCIGFLSRKDSAFVRGNKMDWSPRSTVMPTTSPGVIVSFIENFEPVPEDRKTETATDYNKRRAMTFSRKLIILANAGLEAEDSSDTSLTVEFDTPLENPLADTNGDDPKEYFKDLKVALIAGLKESKDDIYNYQKSFWAYDFQVADFEKQSGKMRGWLFKARLKEAERYRGPINIIRKEDGSFVVFMVEHASPVEFSDFRDKQDITDP